MNKYDFILIFVVLIISILLVSLDRNDNNYAYVYYDNKLINTINLNKDNKYIVNGYNGEVELEIKNNKLKVINENSPLHLCSKKDFTNKGVIVCLPNKIVIKFNDELDTRVG